MDRSHEDPARDAGWLAEIAAGGERGRQALWALSSAYNPTFQLHLVRRGLATDEADLELDKIWLRVARRAPDFDPARGNAAAWLWTIFIGEASEAVQSHHRKGLTYGARDDEGSEHDVPMWSQAPERDVMLWRCVARAMEALWRDDPDGAKLLWLRAAEEWKPEELAAADGRVVGTIKNILSKVRKSAAELLRPCHEGHAQTR